MQCNEWREGRTRVDANFEIPLGWLRNASFASSPSNAKGDESLCGSFDSTDMFTGKLGPLDLDDGLGTRCANLDLDLEYLSARLGMPRISYSY